MTVFMVKYIPDATPQQAQQITPRSHPGRRTSSSDTPGYAIHTLAAVSPRTPVDVACVAWPACDGAHAESTPAVMKSVAKDAI